MDLQHGLIFGFIGVTLTIVGFTIAYCVANYYYKKENKKKEPLSSVEQSLKNLNDIRISNYNDFKKLIEKVIFLSKKKKYKKNIYCLKSDRDSERVYQYFKKVI